jgi:integrase/recombinase XerC
VQSNLLKIAYEHFATYSGYLKTQNMSEHEMRAQLCRVNHFLVFLSTAFSGSENVFTNGFRRDEALKQYKLHLRQNLKSPATSLNVAIESIDKFFQFIGLSPTRLQKESVEPVKPLSDEQLSRFELAANTRLAARERAVICLLVHAGILPEECALLDLNDIQLSPAGGTALIGHGNQRYELKLDASCRLAIRHYLEDRAERYPYPNQQALLIDDRGNRLTAASIDLIVRQLSRTLSLDVSARTLQQTFQYREAMRENKALLAAELLSGVMQVGSF